MLFTGANVGDVADATAYTANFTLLDGSLMDLGPFIISGLTVTAGAGLDVSVAAGTASIGGRLVKGGSFSIMGLLDDTTNHLYLKQDGTGTSNATGVAPANSVKLGTAATAGGVVTGVAQTWASGRQPLVRHESLVHGGGAGHPRAVDLASWHATNNEGNETKGTLAAGALPTTLNAPLTLSADDASQSSVTRVLVLRHTYNAGNGANGIGAGLEMQAENTGGGFSVLGRLDYGTTNAVSANLTSFAELRLFDNNVEVVPLRLESKKLLVAQAPSASANFGLLSLGDQGFAGGGGTAFAGSGNGTGIAMNFAAGYTGDFVNYQLAGVSKFKIQGVGHLTVADGVNLTVGTTTGTQLGTGASQKLGVFGQAPIAQLAATTELIGALKSYGWLGSGGGGTPINTNGGDLTCNAIAASGAVGGSGTAFNWKRFALTFPGDADYTLAVGEKDAVVIDVQAGVITTTRNIIVPGTLDGFYIVINRNAQAVVLKTSGGTGITVAAGRTRMIAVPTGVNAFALTPAQDFTV